MIDYTSSANLKLKLLINGIRIEDNALEGLGTVYKEYQYGYNDSNWINHSKQCIIPSELVLPGNIVVAPHLRPTSHYVIKKEGDHRYVFNEKDHKIESEIDYLKRPKIWDLEMSDGTKLKEYLNVYGMNCLNLFIVANCEFWNEGHPCVFCSLHPTQSLHKEVVMFKSLDKIEESVRLAFEASPDLEWMIITGGSLRDRKLEIKRYIDVLNRIKKHIPKRWRGRIKGNSALLPTTDFVDLQLLHETGIEHPSFNLEVWDENLFKRFCPGKEAHASFKKLLTSYKYAVEIWGPGEVWCNFVGGISPISDLKDGFRFMADLGVVPGANIFHLDPNTVGAKIGLKEPSEKYVLEMYSSLSEIYKEYGYKPFFSESVLRNSLSNEMFYGWI